MPHKSKKEGPPSGETEFKCPECGKICKAALGLGSHIRHKHPGAHIHLEKLNLTDQKRLALLDKIQVKGKELIDARQAVKSYKPGRIGVMGFGVRSTASGLERLKAVESKVERELEALKTQLKEIS